MSVGSVTTSLHADVLAWAKGQLKPWQHEAFRRILKNGKLSQTDYAVILERAQYDLGIAVAAQPLPDATLTTSDLPISVPSEGKLRLKALRDIENVNSLKTGAAIAFGPQLTIIYGENGSGKSGYARILKKIGRCVSQAVEDILPNVYSSPSGVPARATIDIEKDGAVTALSWSDGTRPPVELGQVAVFDSKCARAYVAGENQISFVPSVIDALAELSDATDEVKRRLLGLAASAAPAYPAPLAALAGSETSVGRALSLLSPATDPKALIELAKWDSALEQTFVEKQARLGDLREMGPQSRRAALLAEKQGIVSVQGAVNRIYAQLGDEQVDTLRALDAILAESTRAYEAAAAIALGDSKLSGVGTDAWRALLEAAYQFSTGYAYKNQPFPPDAGDAVCVLCQQPLQGEAASRLATFWAFLQQEAPRRRDAARRSRDQAFVGMAIRELMPHEVLHLQRELEAREPTLWRAFLDLMASAIARTAAIQESIDTGAWGSLPTLHMTVRDLCTARVKAMDTEIAATGGIGGLEEPTGALSSEVEELRARKRFATNLLTVLEYLEALKHRTALKAAADSIATKGITFKAKSLYGSYVTGAFRAKVLERMKQLGLRRAGVGIDDKPEKGKVLHSIKLDGLKIPAAPSAVLSEGERSAISLSYFLSDLGLLNETSIIVFDDPVTSLDHRIRDGAVRLFVAEAKDRQVVIFTHDLGFFQELMTRAQHDEIPVVAHHIESLGPAVGLVMAGKPWDAMSVGQRVGELQKHIATAKAAETAGEVDGYRLQVARFYSRLRATWERAVEELLFNGVIFRYERAVKTMQLDGVAVDKQGITAVFDAMTKCSGITDAHDSPAGANVATPTTTDMVNDLANLESFRESQKDKKKTAEKAYAHLKAKA